MTKTSRQVNSLTFSAHLNPCFHLLQPQISLIALQLFKVCDQQLTTCFKQNSKALARAQFACDALPQSSTLNLQDGVGLGDVFIQLPYVSLSLPHLSNILTYSLQSEYLRVLKLLSNPTASCRSYEGTSAGSSSPSHCLF